jgi:cyclopropane-fatty-acyl-phospholipid synthase
MTMYQLTLDRGGARSNLTGAVALFGQGIEFGLLTVRGPDGWSQTFRGRGPGPTAELQINRPRALMRTLTGGALGFAEAYIDGDCDSPDLVAFLELAALNQNQWKEQLKGKIWYRAAARGYHILRRNTQRGARRNIIRHYDLGNAFYAKWLDPTMTYSSAAFADTDQDLATAQLNKYRLIAETAALDPHDHVLEIGCGWGGFATYAATEIGCRVTAITISDAQFQYTLERIAREGLDGRVTVELRDYRNLTGVYDKIVSIEMIEAVGEAYWPDFFAVLRRSLRPGGIAALQAITIDDAIFDQYRTETDFIQRHIFPGGMLPSPSVLRERAAGAGLGCNVALRFGADYARTLLEWRTRFERVSPEIADMGFDDRFRRLWLYYLSYCEAGFRTGQIDVHQIAFTRN